MHQKQPKRPRILFIDIETAPNICYVWGLFKQNISHDQVEASSYILCYTAMWAEEKDLLYLARTNPSMLKTIHALLDEADIVVHYNGTKFDIPTLNKEFVKADMPPPSPYRQIDLYRVVREAFRFESNKMDAVAKHLKIGEKVKHRGFELWVGCMKGDKECWSEMERYNRQDVVLLEKLYYRLRPWMTTHPHLGLYTGGSGACPTCGSTKLTKQGVRVLKTLAYQQFKCLACGSWCRARQADKDRKVEYV